MRLRLFTGLLAALSVTGIRTAAAAPAPATPIQHVVIIFQENQSFDHYFGTYPNAANPAGEPSFHPAPGTPTVNGLTSALLTHNPNLYQPWRIDRSQAIAVIGGECDNNHGYNAEQLAYDSGLLDHFVQFAGPPSPPCPPNFVMGYVDGNTVTALWNYAQRFTLNDDYFGATFGPSMPGAINLASGQTGGALPANVNSPGGSPWVVNGTMIGNPPAAFDDCAEETGTTVQMTGQNVGDLLNAAGLTWGWFTDGFTPTSYLADGTAVCGLLANTDSGFPIQVYDDPDPFDYYASTSNPHHLPPSSPAMIGKTDQANHNYEFDDFWTAAEMGNMPAVSFLRGSETTDGHPQQSDPLAEQAYLVGVMNRLQQLPEWKNTAVFITWDDSDGWYDHVMGPIINQSQDPAHDALLPGSCGTNAPAGGNQDRCGHGPRIPLLILSPYARENFVNDSLSDTSSLIKFIEDNWGLGRIGAGSLDALAGSLMDAFDFNHPQPAPLLLDPETGEPVGASRQD
jgi:phospholipase C